MLAQDTTANTTYVALFSPPAGTWRLDRPGHERAHGGRPAAGAGHGPRAPRRADVVRSRVGGRPAAAVRRARPQRRGERAADDAPLARPGALHARSGDRRAPAHRGDRHQRAACRGPRYTVARYRVAPPGRPQRIRAIRLRSRTLTWRRDRNSVSYVVAVTRRDGTTSTHTTRRPRLRVGTGWCASRSWARTPRGARVPRRGLGCAASERRGPHGSSCAERPANVNIGFEGVGRSRAANRSLAVGGCVRKGAPGEPQRTHPP